MNTARVAIETDSVNLVAAVTSDRFDQALGGVLFREIRVLLSLHFVTLSFSHVSRNCNGCAHELACSGLQRDPDQPVIWSDPLPSFVKNLVVRDLIDQVNKENKLESQKKKTCSLGRPASGPRYCIGRTTFLYCFNILNNYLNCLNILLQYFQIKCWPQMFCKNI